MDNGNNEENHEVCKDEITTQSSNISSAQIDLETEENSTNFIIKNGNNEENHEVCKDEIAIHSSNISSAEIDAETEEKLRGDAIGNSLYSQSFVLKTLMQFSNVEWSEQFEEDLCFLWDMTLDKDVCEFLFNMSYPSLVCTAVQNCDEPRFIEIVIGILGNMFCASCEKSISLNEVTLILDTIHTLDPLILIQVMRFITAVTSEFESLPFLSDEILDCIKFILNNSTNIELLLGTIDAIVKITTDFKLSPDKIDSDLIDSCFSGFKTIFCKHKYSDKGVLKNIVQFMCNVCGYMTNFEDNRLRDVVMENSKTFITEVAKLMQYYNSEKHIFPLSTDFDFYVEATSYLIVVLSVGYHSSLFLNTFKIISLLLKHECEVTRSLLEIMTYLTSKGERNNIKSDLQKFNLTEINKVFSLIDYKEIQF